MEHIQQSSFGRSLCKEVSSYIGLARGALTCSVLIDCYLSLQPHHPAKFLIREDYSGKSKADK